MIIGVPKEIKNNENRVALTPAGAKELIKRGHQVYVQQTAGIGSGFSDEDYIAAGAHILPSIEATYQIAEMIMKVKEPSANRVSCNNGNRCICKECGIVFFALWTGKGVS